MKISIKTKIKNIEDVSVGEYAVSYNHITNNTHIKEILQTYVTNVEKDNQIRISLYNGDFFVCSSIHKMFIVGKGYIEARKIKSDDYFLDINNNSIQIKNVDKNLEIASETFYDLEIDALSCYFVRGKSGNSYLSHNSTSHYPIWHYDIEDIIVLKNNKGSEDNRVRHMDHSIQISELFYKRYLNEEKITLFCPSDVKELYDAWGSDNFDEIYLACEKRTDIVKKQIDAIQLFESLMSERFETGRIYIQNIDHCNKHSHSKLPITMSNLCQEITLPTNPISSIDDTEGRIATCILSALNIGRAKFSEYEKLCDIMVRALDELIDYQRYPIIAAEIYTKSQRTLGIGIINYAYYLAKNKAAWDSEEARKLTHQMAERFQYSLLKASNNLAKERGACSEFNTSKYSDGILPIDTYSKFLDTFANFGYECDWETLRESIKQYGLRNNALSALMPSESSSVVSNATSGVEPPRGYSTVKRNKKGDMKMIVPGYSKFKNYYELLFDMGTTKPYIRNLAIIQKFVDQSISTNTSYNPEHYEGKEIPMSVLIDDLIYSQKCGIKTLYYNNTYDMDENDKSDQKPSGCDSGACTI